ncbi:MAG TPA: glycine oxidase ThiO [Pirellulales bacterium]|nr:glycine oxidase ThiO [Pirellulales bacterium]
MATYDCLILGGGVIGMSLAYELACQGLRVGVIDRGVVGGEASWAGAGILPPAAASPEAPAEAQLRALANTLHAQWTEQLLEETGIDNGYRVCGGLYLDRQPGGPETLSSLAGQWRSQSIRVQQVPAVDLANLEPAIASQRLDDHLAALYLPDEAQLRNPRHLKALYSACVRRGVTVHEATEVHDFVVRGRRVDAARTTLGSLAAEQFCLASGAWTGGLASRLGCRLELKPIRGQIALLQDEPGRLRHVVNDGRSYLVPRPDGRILVGSTEEDAGFDKRPTAEGIAGLLDFALELAPSLATARLERTWAGLRPGSVDGLPYLGVIPELDNAFVAAGHFRSGLQLSTATAVVMGQMIRGQDPGIDLAPFSPTRSGNPAPHLQPAT